MVKKPVVYNKELYYQSVAKFDYEIKDEKITVEVIKCAIEPLIPSNDQNYNSIQTILKQTNFQELSKVNEIKVWINGAEVILQKDQHFRLL